VEDIPEDAWTRGLIRAAGRNRPGDDDESIEGDTKRGGSNDNRRDGSVDSPKVEGKARTEEQEGEL